LSAKVNKQESGLGWTIYNGDCCEVVSGLPDESVGFSVYSPPFSDIYSYSNNLECMSNCEDDDQFFEHYRYLVEQNLRVTRPGRLSSVHCMNLPMSIQRHGVIGLRDFRGKIIKCHEDAGWIYHAEVCVWKDPVTAMQRTKALGLLHKQIKKDSAMSRQGLADYVCTFRKPGKNTDPISGELKYFSGDMGTFENTGNLSIDIWQRYASPVWMDINQSRTLNNYREGRDQDDTKHICPLQLDVIERCLQLWSKPDDVVLSPFLGIGSEGYESVRLGRKFIGVELKESYFDVAAKNLVRAEAIRGEASLFQEQL
jgi:hypothetical protein